MELLARQSLRIVHLEDEDVFAELTAVTLKRAGFTQPLVHFPSGDKVIDYLSKIEPERAPHVVLIDLYTPGISGLEVLRWLRQHSSTPDVAVYMLTCSDDPEDLQRSAAAGATKYFLKNLLFDELIHELDQWIATHNHKLLDEIKGMPEPMAELALMSGFTNQMIVLTNPEGQVEWVNAPFTQACGYTLQELRGKIPGRMLQGPESDPVAVEMLHRAVHTVSTCDCQIINYKKDGTAYQVNISLGPVFSNGKLNGFLAVETCPRADLHAP